MRTTSDKSQGVKDASGRYYGLPLAERIKVMSLPVPCGCWLWQASSKNKKGYGSISLNGRVTTAHRASYEAFVGPVPTGLMVLHHCDTRSCVNPEHLFLGTAKDNDVDRASKGRSKGPRGERVYGSKLTAAQVDQLRRENWSSRQVADTFGISMQSAWRARTGRGWRWR